jgi:L,D-transpeptidase YcbB
LTSNSGIALAEYVVVGNFLRTRRVAVIVASLLATVVIVACGRLQLGSGETRREMDAALRETLQASRPAFLTKDQEGTRLWKQTQQFYEHRAYQPAWTKNAEPGSQMKALVGALRAAGDEGLDPELYGVSLLDKKLRDGSKGFLTKQGFDPREAATLDVWLTYLYMKYASDLADGLSDLAHADPSWRIKPEQTDPLAQLEKALSENRVAESLLDLTPDAPEYRALRKTLAEYRAQAAKGGWPQVPANVKLKPGQRGPQVAPIAAHLAATGDLAGGQQPADQTVYDATLQEAVKRFQRRHGFQDDGIVTPALAAEMNVPIEERITEIVLSMERWRWLPRTLGDRYIFVNIPDMRLDVWEKGQVPLSMRVIVGKQDTPTPIFNDDMTHIVFSPYWNVPPNIAQGETLPSIIRDPGFLARNNMEIVDKAGRVVDPSAVDSMDLSSYRFRQRPGGDNALGFVKFMFPNQFDVYLHDTPTDSLFGRAARLFSHGCVRVEKPEELAIYLLRDQPEWTPERIRAAMHAGEERHVKLRQPVPVYIGYWTARVAPDGIVQFRKDAYGLDGRQMAMLDERLGRLRAATAGATAATAKKSDKGKPAKPRSR